MGLSVYDFQLMVFAIDNSKFEPLGELNQFSSVIWPKAYQKFSEFELWAPITEENNGYFKPGNVIWKKGTDEAVVIEIVEPQIDDVGNKNYSIRGRTIECYLCSRIIWKTYNAQDKKASTVIYEIVNSNCINTSDSKRKIPYLEIANDPQIGEVISYQSTGAEVYDAINEIAEETNLGFKIAFDPINKKMRFMIYQGVDRTINQSSNTQAVFSSDTEDVLQSSYYMNTQDYKSMALVAGEGEGKDKKYQEAGNKASSGFLRKELFVDAKSLRSKTANSAGEEVVVSAEEYGKMLIQKGEESLSRFKVSESFDAAIRSDINAHNKLGVDYNLGDLVTVIDNQLNVIVSARITEITESVNENYSLDVVFGYGYPTIFEKMKRTT